MESRSENIFGDFLKTCSDRISSPISGTFILAWLMINWRVPLILIYGSESSEHRRDQILNAFNGTGFYNFLHTVILPLVVTVLYVLVMPYIRAWYSMWSDRFEYQSATIKVRLANNLKEVSIEGETYKEHNDRLRSACASSKTTLEQILNFSESMNKELKTKKGEEQAMLTEISLWCQNQIIEIDKALKNRVLD